MTDLIRELQEFWNNDPARNTWLQSPAMNVYVRKSNRLYPKKIQTLDIASIEVELEHQDQGMFTTFLNEAEQMGVPIYIENVFHSDFQRFFEKRGYEIKHRYQDGTISYFYPNSLGYWNPEK